MTRTQTIFTQPHMNTWPVQDAKARFSEFLNATLTIGPQVVTYHGKQAAVLLPVAQWERLKQLESVDIKDWLLHQGPKFTDGLPLPGKLDMASRQRRRRAPVF
jgi:antitoxin Phd